MSVSYGQKGRARHKRPALRRHRGILASRRLNLESLECRNLLTAGLELPALDLWGEPPEMLLHAVAVEESEGWSARVTVMEDHWKEASEEAVSLSADDDAVSIQIAALAMPLEDSAEVDEWADGEFRITMVTEPGDTTLDGEVHITSTDEVVAVTGGELSPLHNAANPYDVNGDGLVGPLDALIVVNYINAGGDGAPQLMSAASVEAVTYFVDVDGDGEVGPLDVIRLMNVLNGADPEEIDAALPAGVAPLWSSPLVPHLVQEPVRRAVEEIESGHTDLLFDAGRYAVPPSKPNLVEEGPSRDGDGLHLYEEDLIFSDNADWLLPDLL